MGEYSVIFVISNKTFRAFRRLIAGALALFAVACGAVKATPAHRDVLVFIPAYEGSQLFDPNLTDATAENPTRIWVNLGAYFSRTLYFALRNPNPLQARLLEHVGPLDVYSGFTKALTQPSEEHSAFAPYTLGTDFFIFNYDWRQDIATVSAPQFARTLAIYAEIHAQKTGLPADRTHFIIITHSMGGLVARTWLSENPAWAPRVTRMILAGPPNRGSVKAVKTVVYGPDSLESVARGFPGVLFKLLPTDVNQRVTKLTGISRPSLYELLPYDDPRWTDQTMRRRYFAADLLRESTWQPYWPTAESEKELFLDDWLQKRVEEGRKQITPGDWEFCQDPELPKLRGMLLQTAAWRAKQGTLEHTARLLTGQGQAPRLRLVLGTGMPTPTGVVTRGTHDETEALYTYDRAVDGDGTVTEASALDGWAPASPNVRLLPGVSHGRLMIDRRAIDYFLGELSHQPLLDTHR